MNLIDRYSAETMARYNFTEFVDTFMANQEEMLLQEKTISSYETTVNQINNVLPDTNRTLWWITNLIKIIQLIIEILKNAPKKNTTVF